MPIGPIQARFTPLKPLPTRLLPVGRGLMLWGQPFALGPAICFGVSLLVGNQPIGLGSANCFGISQLILGPLIVLSWLLA